MVGGLSEDTQPRKVMEKGIAYLIMLLSWKKIGSCWEGLKQPPLDITGNASGGLLSGRMVAKRALQTFAMIFNQRFDHWKRTKNDFHLWSQIHASILKS